MEKYEKLGIEYSAISPFECKVVRCVSPEAHMLIPIKVNGYYVAQIGEDAFKGVQTLKSIQFPDSIRSILAGAFQGCSELENIMAYETEQPCHQMTVGVRAFAECERLNSISISCPVRLQQYAFQGCKSIFQMNMPVMQCADYAFAQCTSMSKLVFANTASWTATSFDGCRNIRTIEFLGDIARFMRKARRRVALDVFQDVTILCGKDCKLTELIHEGFTVKIV